MTIKKKISTGIKFKKYFQSWFVILVTFLIIKLGNITGFWMYFGYVFSILFGLFCFSMKKVEYTTDKIYFNNKEFDYKSITSLKTLEINNRIYWLFKTNSNKIFDKYHFTQLGGINYLDILKILIKKKKVSDLKIAEFTELLKQKSSISFE